MKTLSKEEFESKYGKGAAARFGSNDSDTKGIWGNYVDRLKANASSGANKTKDAVKDVAHYNNVNPAPIFEGALKFGSGVVDTVFSPITAAVQPVVDPTLGRVVRYAGDKISDNKTVQRFANSKAGRMTSRVVEDANNLNTIAGAVAGSKGVGKLLGFTTDAISEAATGTAGAIERAASKVPSKTMLTDMVTPIPKTTETALGEIKPQMFEHLVSVGKQAMEYRNMPTPMQYVGEIANRSLGKIQKQLETAGEWKGKVLDSVGHNRVGDIGAKARASMWSKLEERVGVTMDGKNGIVGVNGRLPSIAKTADYTLIKEVDSKLAQLGHNPTLRELDDAVDYIQNKLYDSNTPGQIPINGKVEGALKEISGQLNAHAKSIGGNRYAQASKTWSELYNLRNEANLALGTKGNKGAALMKQLFSPSGAAPRKLFSDIKKATGVDLANHAEIAKFVMENLGDVRQANLLEQVLKGEVSPSKSGIINYLVDKGLTSLQDPFGKARRIMEASKK